MPRLDLNSLNLNSALPWCSEFLLPAVGPATDTPIIDKFEIIPYPDALIMTKRGSMNPECNSRNGLRTLNDLHQHQRFQRFRLHSPIHHRHR